MPRMNGKDLAEKLMARRTNMKVLFISGHLDNVIIHHGINATDVAFLQKPYTMETLTHKIRHVFEN